MKKWVGDKLTDVKAERVPNYDELTVEYIEDHVTEAFLMAGRPHRVYHLDRLTVREFKWMIDKLKEEK